MTKKISILGAGESGIGAALLGQSLGYDVFVSDKGQIAAPRIAELKSSKIPYESGAHSTDKILQADTIIVSPGIPLSIPLLLEARSQSIECIGEIEFAARHSNAHLIGITGTNGKTTTTLLTEHVLRKAGLDAIAAGNLGKSFARILSESDHDYFVLELSSFQLETMSTTRINHAVLLNISPDHLDRYDGMAEYTAAKFRISNNQTEDDFFIYCMDSTPVANAVADQSIPSRLIPFSLDKRPGSVSWTDDESFHFQLDPIKQQFDMNFNQMTIGGKHNTYNSMAAAIVANSLLIRNEVIRESLMDFKNVEHRLEPVAKVKGVQFINDSKATNVNAAWYALESVNTPIVWIAGGVDKGNDYAILENLVAEKVRVLICMGKNNIKLHQAFGKHVDLIINTTSADEAVKMAHGMANYGETVLLAPACASFDLFEDYEDRGRQFKYAVKNL